MQVARARLLTLDHRHTSFHLSRADLGGALSLLGRMLDELD